MSEPFVIGVILSSPPRWKRDAVWEVRELVRCFIQDISAFFRRRRTVRFDSASDDVFSDTMVPDCNYVTNLLDDREQRKKKRTVKESD